MSTPYEQAVEATCRHRHSTRFDTPTIAYACDECRETVAFALPHLLAPIEALAGEENHYLRSGVTGMVRLSDLRAALASIKGQPS